LSESQLSLPEEVETRLPNNGGPSQQIILGNVTGKLPLDTFGSERMRWPEVRRVLSRCANAVPIVSL